MTTEQDARHEHITATLEEQDRQELRPLHCGFAVGDQVTIGKGKTVWVIGGFWGERDELASLEPVEGYSGTSVHVDRLKAVQS